MLTNIDINGIGGELGDKADEILDEVSAATGLSPTVCAIAIVVLVAIAIFIFTKPIRLVLKVVINTCIGFVALFLINKLGADYGISLAISWQNAVVTGIFGVPGVAVLLALKWGGII